MNHSEDRWKDHARKLFLVSAIPGLIVPMYFVTLYQPNPLATISIGSIYFWSTLFIWFSLMCDWHLFNKIRAAFIPFQIRAKDATSPLTENIQ